METGRNDPCPCGSGKKYKKCCLQNDVANAPGRRLDFTYESSLILRGRVIDKLDRLLVEKIDQDDAMEFLEDYWTVPMLGLKEVDKLRSNAGTREVLERQIPIAMRNALMLGNRSPARYFLQEYPERFTKDELAFLRDFSDATLSYVQLREFFPESGYSVAEDVFDSTIYKIFDKKISQTGSPHVIVGARLVPLPAKEGHVFEFISESIVLPHQKPMLIEILTQEARDYVAAEAGKEPSEVVTAADIHALLKGDPIVFYWVEMLIRFQAAFPGKPRVTTTDGEEIVFIKAIFSCPDIAAMEAAILAQRNFSLAWVENEKSFIWMSPKKVMLGSVRLDGSRKQLIVETNSRERFRKWEKKLRSLGDVDFLEKHEEAFDASQARNPEPGSESETISPEEMAALAPQIEAQFAEQWLKEKIPMLGGQTPVQASRTPKGREALKELFDYMENQEARLPKGFSGGFNLDAMKKRLGIDK